MNVKKLLFLDYFFFKINFELLKPVIKHAGLVGGGAELHFGSLDAAQPRSPPSPPSLQHIKVKVIVSPSETATTVHSLATGRACSQITSAACLTHIVCSNAL